MWREELWILGYTGTGDAHMYAGGWAVRYQRWRGMPWTADTDERWRFSYRVTSEDGPAVYFSMLVYPEDGNLRCELQG
jgi:hypothetical protein